ncbi:MAG TPA: hypothetical protein VK928_10405 [Longimicrobiales bacterium]|nr:hypothetical protein [Longimicrobiales bacterium]
MMRLLILATALLAACSGGGSGATDVSDDRFIDTIVELRRAAVENPGGFAAAKAQILAENGVTEESLRAYINAHIDDLGRLAAAWDTVNARLAPAEDPIE